MKIGFLFNHDQIHQVAHSLPIALAIAERHAGVEVVLITTTQRLTNEVRRLCGLAKVDLPLVQLGLRSHLTRFIAERLDNLLPAAKLAVYRDNLDFFRQFNALVVAEKTSAILKTVYGLNDLKLIHTRHGAGDRAIGFNRASARFDHVLVSGPKIRDRLIAEAGVSPQRISVVGYPKFDIVPKQPKLLDMQSNGRKTVIYNPHVSPHLSSWYRDGRAVLEHFYRDQRHNLIFAPHVMLFHRPFVLTIDKFRIDRAGVIPDHILSAPNIHVDLGSAASTDMTYTNAADLYLGDVSSQIYEFLLRPRPCLFLNSHGVDYAADQNYRHWRAGPVIGKVADLGQALDCAFASEEPYRPIQQQMFAESFDLRDEPSASRAARAIVGVASGAEIVTPLRWQRQSGRVEVAA